MPGDDAPAPPPRASAASAAAAAAGARRAPHHHHHPRRKHQPPPPRRLRILCLHGSRQTGEIFAARLRQVRRKLEPVADLVFVDAPHPAPRATAADDDADGNEDAAVIGRAFWRHWNLASSSDSPAAAAGQQPPQPPSSPRTHAALPTAEARAAAVERQLAEGGWADVVVRDWRHSLLHLDAVLSGRRDPDAPARATLAEEEAEAAVAEPPSAAAPPCSPFDGVLGFSNGAAASALLAAHAAARAAAGCPVYGALRFFVLAGGYVAEPRARLVEAGLVEARHCERSGAGGPPNPPPHPQKHHPLPFASLHCIGEADPVIAPEDSLALAALFDPAQRRVLRHPGGHHFPQRAEHAAELLEFLRGFVVSAEAAGGFDGGGSSGGSLPLPPPPRPPPPARPETLAPPPPPPTEEQIQEMEALEAIYGSSGSAGAEEGEEGDGAAATATGQYRRVSERPPRFVVRLSPAPDADAAGAGQAAVSTLFSLIFTLPPGYPRREEPPRIEIEGPLGGADDPHRVAMRAALADVVAREAEAAGGEAGYAYQVVEAMREWADEHLPPDIAGKRRSGVVAATAAAAAAAAAAAGGEGGADQGDGGDQGGAPWWEEEEADKSLMRWAMERVAAQPWRTPWTPASSLLGAAAAASSSSAAAATGPPPPHPHPPHHLPHQHSQSHRPQHPGGRGRWDLVVGLVGKPSAGKSTLFNALTDPQRPGEEAKEGAFPFTTIAPNTGRGFALLPDPALAAGLSADDCRPAHGYARGFDLGALERATVQGEGEGGGGGGPAVALHNMAPLRAALEATAAAAAHDAPSSSPCWPELWRRVPITVRDVAGLVPGAYAGKGRGNAFLGDLCDADVLVHVVDVSGTTTAEGALATTAAAAGGESGVENGGSSVENGAAVAAAAAEASGASDPRHDVTWVAEEIHLWVYNNVRVKWGVVRRRPHRLPELFSGYQASRALVDAALRHAGVPPSLLALSAAASAGTSAAAEAAAAASELGRWTARELHLLVATFVAVRFPTLLALNKADLPGASARIAAVRRAFPREAAVAVSARAERWLLAQRREGKIAYGADNGLPRALEEAAAEPLRRLMMAGGGGGDGGDGDGGDNGENGGGLFRQLGGGTGVAAVLATAVALRRPTFFLPVGDRTTCAAIAVGGRGGAGGGSDAKARAAEGRDAGVLRDCVLMRPGSTVLDAFEALKRPPIGLLAGDFVRAEAAALTVAGAGASREAAAPAPAPAPLSWRVVRKEEVLSPSGCCVLYVQTTRRSTWQAAARQRQQEGGEGGGGDE